jgi:hypothetical protein
MAVRLGLKASGRVLILAADAGEAQDRTAIDFDHYLGRHGKRSIQVTGMRTEGSWNGAAT